MKRIIGHLIQGHNQAQKVLIPAMKSVAVKRRKMKNPPVKRKKNKRAHPALAVAHRAQIIIRKKLKRVRNL